MSKSAAMEFRKRLQGYAAKAEPVEFKGTMTDREVLAGSVDVPVRVYRPESTHVLPTVFFLHGGGFVAGSLDTHDNACRVLATHLEAVIVSVEYPLAPESTFRETTRICYEVLCWVAAKAKQLGGTSENLWVIGDSAGGNLAVVCALMARDDQSGPKLSKQLLINPIVDLANPGVYADYRDCYLEKESDQTDPHASPLYAELHDLPHAIVVMNEEDCLYKQNQEFVEKLKQAGVAVESEAFPGGHLGHHFASMDVRGREAVDWIAKQI